LDNLKLWSLTTSTVGYPSDSWVLYVDGSVCKDVYKYTSAKNVKVKNDQA